MRCINYATCSYSCSASQVLQSRGPLVIVCDDIMCRFILVSAVTDVLTARKSFFVLVI